MKRAWPCVEPYVFTNPSKTELIQRLIVAIEQRKVSWPAPSGVEGPAPWTVLTDELRRYEYAYTDSRRLSYAAPACYHDDCVIALALANALRRDCAPPPLMPIPIPHPRATARAVARALP